MGDASTEQLQALDAKLKTILPEQYKECYEDVQPVSMGSAGLKFDAAGRVAWDEIWGSFCDLAMAGGPPHRGTLLEPASPEQIVAEPKAYRAAADEICRGIRMVTELAVDRAEDDPGWVHLFCADAGMSGWMTRAIVMENVSARMHGSIVKLPAGPHFRLAKEIKNVITSVAKTAHYYVHHTSQPQKRAIAELFAQQPLLQPESSDSLPSRPALAEAIGLPLRDGPQYLGWLGLRCDSVREAIWIMRALVVESVLARREESSLHVPVNATIDPGAARIVAAVTKARVLWKLKMS
jgi:hypothetical protein